MTTLTIPLGDLRRTFDAVLPHAASDDVPPIAAVRLDWDGKRLRALATDRYTIGCYRLELSGQPKTKWTFTLGTADVRRILLVFPRPPRRKSTIDTRDVTVDVSDGVITIAEADPFGMGNGGVTLRFREVEGDYPKVSEMLAQALAAETKGVPAGINLNPAFFPRFSTVRGRRDPLRFTFSGPLKPVIVRHNDDAFLGLLMPVRMQEGGTEHEIESVWAAEFPAPKAKSDAKPKLAAGAA